MDLGYHGLPFTWDNRQDDDRNVKVRLDQALGDSWFMETLGGTEVFHLSLTESDHTGLLVEVQQKKVVASDQNRSGTKTCGNAMVSIKSLLIEHGILALVRLIYHRLL
jgi:hypothetical protein